MRFIPQDCPRIPPWRVRWAAPTPALLALLAAALLLALAGSAAAEDARLSVHAPDGAPATAFLAANVTGPRDLRLVMPPGAAIDGFSLDGGPAAWRWADAGALGLEVPAGDHRLLLHAGLSGPGPWRIGGIAPLVVDAPGLMVAVDSAGVATFTRLAPDVPAPWIAVVAAGALALVAAAALARRDLARGPPAEASGLLGHLRELQSRLRVAAGAVLALIVLFAAVGLGWARVAGVRVPVPTLGPPTVAAAVYRRMVVDLVPEGVTLVVLRPMDAVLAELWVAALLGLLAALPVVAYETAAFLGPALLPKERRLALQLAPAVAGLFLAGAAFGYLLLVPILLRTLYAFAPGLGASSFLVVPELVTFAALLALVMGVVFQIPIVMAALARAGAVAPRTFASTWRHALVAIFLIAAIVTPDPTVVSQLFVAVPMAALSALGVGAAYAAARARPRSD